MYGTNCVSSLRSVHQLVLFVALVRIIGHFYMNLLFSNCIASVGLCSKIHTVYTYVGEVAYDTCKG